MEKPNPNENGNLPRFLQVEINQLDNKFHVALVVHTGFSPIRLVCYLDIKCSHEVPPIHVLIPENYPKSAPSYEIIVNDAEYTNPELILALRKKMLASLAQLPEKLFLTDILETWAMAIMHLFT